MKMSKYIFLVSLALAVGVSSSCSREEDEIFDKSAADRLTEAQENYYNILCSAPNGWEMLYFASGSEQGYNFLMKFEQGDKVTIAARNVNTGDAYTEETSAFDVIADDGPVLTFNTYNTLFHRYSDPQPDGSGEANLGSGSDGDYEFKIMSGTADMIYMRGKKHGVEIYMYPLDAETSWTQYFDEVYAMRDRLFSSLIPQYWLTLADGKRYTIGDGYAEVYYPSQAATVQEARDLVTDQVMGVVPEGGDPETETAVVSYIVTRSGIRWTRDFPGDTLTTTPAREFVFNDEGTYLVSTDFGGEDVAAGATIKAPAASELFIEQGIVWRIDSEDLGGQFATLYTAIDEGLRAAHSSWRLNYLQFSYYASAGYYSLLLRNASSNCRYYANITSTGDGGINFDFTGEGDRNGETVLERVPVINDFLNLLNSTEFTLSADSELTPTRIKFTSNSNQNDYFYVDLQ